MRDSARLNFDIAQIEAELREPVTAPRFVGVTIRHAMGYAPWPVWRGSSRTPTKWVPIQKADAQKWFKKAENWKALDSLPGAGRAALAVYRSLLFDFLNWKTGRLDPSYEAIVSKCRWKRSVVSDALQDLKALGIIAWCRRCRSGTGKDGRFILEQETNAYFILPPSQWHGFTAEAAPQIDPEAWGATPPLPAEARPPAPAVKLTPAQQAEARPPAPTVELTPAQRAEAAANLAKAEADLAIFRAARARRAGRAPPD